jgi:hypothetical protein
MMREEGGNRKKDMDLMDYIHPVWGVKTSEEGIENAQDGWM